MSAWSDTRVPHAAGAVDERHGGVAEAFAQNFDEGAENGAAFAAMIGGELAVDIRGGFADKEKEQPWTEETLAGIYSTGKSVLAFLVAMEVSSGRLDYEAPVAEIWPEFAAQGKSQITLAEALSHQAGLAALPEGTPPQTYLDWDATCAIIAEMAPLWTPGSANGYHPQTFGFIVGEVLRRATGKSVGALLDDWRDKMGAQIYCGMGPLERARAAYMPKPPKAPDLGELNEYTKLAFLKPSSAPAKVGRDEWMAAQIPASNMHADARSLAKFLFPLANRGVGANQERVIDAAIIDQLFEERSRGDDLVLPFHLSWCAGLMRNINGHFGPNRSSYGHAGFGGSCVVIDPERNMCCAYVMSKMSPYLVGDPRALRMIDALYAAL